MTFTTANVSLPQIQGLIGAPLTPLGMALVLGAFPQCWPRAVALV